MNSHCSLFFCFTVLVVSGIADVSNCQRTAKPIAATTATAAATAASAPQQNATSSTTAFEVPSGQTKTLTCDILGNRIKINRARYTISGASQKSVNSQSSCPDKDVTTDIGAQCDGGASCNVIADAGVPSCSGRTLLIDYSCFTRASTSSKSLPPRKAFVNIFYDGVAG